MFLFLRVVCIGWSVGVSQKSLVAATSPSTKVTEESLTYLNQGQSYGIRITRRPEEFQKANIPLKWVEYVMFNHLKWKSSAEW